MIVISFEKHLPRFSLRSGLCLHSRNRRLVGFRDHLKDECVCELLRDVEFGCLFLLVQPSGWGNVSRDAPEDLVDHDHLIEMRSFFFGISRGLLSVAECLFGLH